MEEPRSPSLAQVIRQAVESQASALRVSLPGRIEKYDAKTRRANVKPLVNDVFFDFDGVRKAESLPVVTDVPVLFPGGGGFSLTFPVRAGDVCLLLFADSSLDVWKARGGEVDPREVRPHDLSNAVALVGLEDFAHATPAHADNAVLGTSDGARVEVTPSGEIIINGGTKLVAREGDSIQITVTPADVASWGLVSPTGPVSSTAPFTLTGKITSGAAKVKA